jgi:hypothetical protein
MIKTEQAAHTVLKPELKGFRYNTEANKTMPAKIVETL